LSSERIHLFSDGHIRHPQNHLASPQRPPVYVHLRHTGAE